jgi:hypothetical protein
MAPTNGYTHRKHRHETRADMLRAANAGGIRIYKETRDKREVHYERTVQKREMWTKNRVAVGTLGERLRQWQHSEAPAAEGPRGAQPEGIT